MALAQPWATVVLSGAVTPDQLASNIAAEAITRGGASDAAHAAAVGVPAICGLGPVASGIHTDEERTSVGALRRSAVVAAALLCRLQAWKDAGA